MSKNRFKSAIPYFVVLVLILWFLSFASCIRHIESHLKDKTTETLRTAGYTVLDDTSGPDDQGLKVELSGRKPIITGLLQPKSGIDSGAWLTDEKDKIQDLLENTDDRFKWNLREADVHGIDARGQIIKPVVAKVAEPKAVVPVPVPAAKPKAASTFDLSVSPEKLVAKGTVPNADVKQRLLSSITSAFPNKTLDDQVKVSMDVREDGWQGSVPGFINSFASSLASDQGTISVDDSGTVTLDGTVKTAPSVASVGLLANKITGTPTKVNNRLKAVPAPVAAPLTGSTFGLVVTAAGITTSGTVPSTTVKSDLIKSIQTSFPTHKLTDKLTISDTVRSDAWQPRVPALVSDLSKSLQGKDGSLNVAADGKITMSGVVKSAADRTRINASAVSIAGTPAKLANGLTVYAPPAPTAPAAPTLPSTFGFTVNGANVTANGTVPSAEAKGKLLSSVQSAFPKKKVVDQVKIGKVANNDFLTRFPALTRSYAGAMQGDRGSAQLDATGKVTLTGFTSTQPDIAKVGSIASSVVGSPNKVVNQLKVRTLRAPSIAATRNPTGVTLTGLVPSKADSDRIAASVQKTLSPNQKLVNQLKVADDVQAAKWLPVYDGALAAATSGQSALSVNGAKATLVGIVPSASDKAKVGQTVQAKLANTGVTLDNQLRIVAPKPAAVPQTVSIARAGNRVNVSGIIQSADLKSPIIQSVKQSFPGAQINDKLTVNANTVDAPWASKLGPLVPQLASVQNGSVSVKGARTILTGTVTSNSAKSQIGAAYASSMRPFNITVDNQINVVAPPPPSPAPPSAPAAAAAAPVAPVVVERGDIDTTQTGISRAKAVEMFNGVIIYFSLDGANIRDDEDRKLNYLAQVMKQHPDINLKVKGFADSSGDVDYNLELSMRRAIQVRDYLEPKGITRNRLQALGRGINDPIADNATREGRALNRRVEFEVR